MLILIIVSLLISYLLLPAIKAIIGGSFTWNKIIGVIFLIPGPALVVLLVTGLILLGLLVYSSVEAAFEDNFIEKYFEKGDYYD
jgi:hypothetical protein